MTLGLLVMAHRLEEGENVRSVMQGLQPLRLLILRLPRIVKSDGERQPFNGVKLKGGMLRALEKRPLSAEEVDGVFGSILTEIRQLGEREIASRQLGEIVMRNLKRVDQVAYVRFASVYRDFQDIKEFAEEISSLSKEKPKRTKKKK